MSSLVSGHPAPVAGLGGEGYKGNKVPKCSVGLGQGKVPSQTRRRQRPASLIQADSLNHSFNHIFIEHLLYTRL